jgi:muconolactone D-isomerase
MEFLVLINNVWPADGDTELHRDLIKAEAARAKELAASGFIKRLWRRPGAKASVGLWQAEDATALNDAIRSLPFFPWLEVEVQPLAQHPNDPFSVGSEPL